jgi:protein disulfide-isomerase-like protein
LTKAAEYFKDDLKIAFVAVDCTKHNQICEQYEVKGYPTIIYFNFGKNPTPYDGKREVKSFIKFMSNPNDPNALKTDPKDDWVEIAGYESVHLLDDSTFDAFVKSKSKVLVMFHAPWCGHCIAMKPAYAQAASELSKTLPSSYLAAVDATSNSKLSQQYSVQGFPTLKYFENGQYKFDYNSGRNKEDFIKFMQDPKDVNAGKAEL